LHLPERAELGRAFYGVIDRLATQDEGFVYMAAHLDSRPSGLSCSRPVKICIRLFCWNG
jgi:hypothetical protein